MGGDRGGWIEIYRVEKKYISNSPDETKQIGFRLGKLLKPGNVIGLFGELGSGKTTLVKGIAKAFGIEERDVVSASFTVISEYDTSPPFFHIDLYRIEKVSELDEIGFRDYVWSDGISVVEWADKAGTNLPEEMITIKLKSLNGETREIIIEGNDAKDWDNL
jgi:tRNA threonylcarbamoyladenosine biosynthesis protein TsaE